MIEMGLVGVVSTQLWHHTYIDASLPDLPGQAIGRADRREPAGNAYDYPPAHAGRLASS